MSNSQPEHLNIDLYDHQLKNISRMEEVERTHRFEGSHDTILETNFSILADANGSGKTLSMIGLILNDKMEWDCNKKHEVIVSKDYCSGNIQELNTLKFDRYNTTLILCPDYIVSHWVSEFAHAPSLRIKTVLNKKESIDVDTSLFDVVIVSSKVFKYFISGKADYAWKRFIYDEPIAAYVPKMKTVRAGFSWFMTATYEVLFNKSNGKSKDSYLKRLFNSSDFYILEKIVIKNDWEFLEESYDQPENFVVNHKCHNPVSDNINGIDLSPEIHIMVESGNIYGAIKALGGEGNENILELIKSQKLKKIEEEKLDNEEIRVITAQITDIDLRIDNIKNGECPICMERLTDPVMEPSCQNVYCGQCIFKWLKNTNMKCPLCRTVIEPSKLIYLKESESNKHIINDHQLLTKQQKTLELIKKEGGKFIIYSKYYDNSNGVKKVLEDNNIEFVEVKGTLKEKEDSIDKYKNGNVNIILLDPTRPGTGSNLQNTTDIIFYHKLHNKSKEVQIIGRANRIGREYPLSIHFLV